METAISILFSFWMCVVYVVFSICMIAIWICVGIMGGPAVRLRRPKIPPPPKLEDVSTPAPTGVPERPLEA